MKHIIDRNRTHAFGSTLGRFARLVPRQSRHPAVRALLQRARPQAGAKRLAFLRLERAAQS